MANNDQLKSKLLRWTFALAVVQMVVGCVWCFLAPVKGEPSLIKSYAAFRGTHHQYTHQAEWTAAVAFIFPYLELSPGLLWLTFVLLQVGTWTNPIAYSIMALTGIGHDMVAGAFPDLGRSEPVSSVVEGTLKLCAVTFLASCVLILIGVSRYRFRAPASADKTK
ncbi:hypothetical protein CAOG_08839 [Capsaspora owczarzaki ATCC 30864]|uniref:Uncharacterized protein n=1 Tax=Capsaspora owczarzaki (strain ATCC 30864) TaxID=595528 RepID=A0A0D2UGR7_CAPO3|nr:hypothetical protein CAOG_08839 [Capsaspora owczarzaki ATCC 30864]KJE94281.1 hypothetical protein CAOG_008839 [Capsaspora owczarzaki ATCC 30864]|eukprot:XP_011270480.1 hypothetical protein CAOG_08839 [Capsaspora owczarzaki ATCC 30864]